jgi:hypothetical protein
LILAAVPSALGGSQATSFTAIFSYIPATTPHHLRSIRFMLVEAITFIASPIASVIGGYLLNTAKYYNIEAIGKNGQLLNYTLVYVISLVLSVLSFFWVIFFVDEIRDKEQLEKFDLNKVHKDLYVPKNREPRPLSRSISEQKPKKNPCLMLFDCGINFLFTFEYMNTSNSRIEYNFLGNVSAIINTCTKKRKNNARKQLWLIIFSIAFFLLAHIGPHVIMFPFSEKVYLWDSSQYSYINSIATFANSIGIKNLVLKLIKINSKCFLGTVFATLLLIKVFKVNDIPLATIGISAYFIASVLRGSLQNLYGYYSGAVVGSIGMTLRSFNISLKHFEY